jgi:predicted alpha/beta-fold hydrolase
MPLWRRGKRVGFLTQRSRVRPPPGVIFFVTLFFLLYFTGHTDDFQAMVSSLVKKHPNTHVIAVGFSLGGNLITKYLGEKNVVKPSNIIGGISICQGYDANE